MSALHKYVSTTKDTKLKISEDSITYRVLRFVWESGQTGRRYSEIVRFIVEEIKNEKYDSSKRGYWATNLILRTGYFNKEKEGILIKYAGKNDQGRWILKDPLLIAHFDGADADGTVSASNGDKYWLSNGLLHREDGPAVIRSNGDVEYWINGKQMSDGEYLKLTGAEEEDIQLMKDFGLFEMLILEKSSVKTVRPFGKSQIEEWRNSDNQLHREDGPAKTVYGETGDIEQEYWYINNRLHREDGPAVNHVGRVKKWFIDGKMHREDGPAIISHEGGEEWYKDGKQHREDGPASTTHTGISSWYIDGKLHREDGPAIESEKYGDEYYLDGWKVDKSEVDALQAKKAGAEEEDIQLMRDLGLFEMIYINEEKEYPVKSETYFDGDRIERWRDSDGELHRENGPAKIVYRGNTDDIKEEHWYKHGKKHREDGPSFIIYNTARDGIEWVTAYYINDGLHREDGPAYTRADGRKAWYINDVPHREDGPAIDYGNGQKEWYINGKRHREDGPALIYPDGEEIYYLDGKRINTADFEREVAKKAGLNDDELDMMELLGITEGKIEEDMIAPMDSGTGSPGSFFQSPETMAGSMDTMSLAGPLTKNKKSKSKSRKPKSSKILSFKDFIKSSRK